jgi:hypothetical protein
MFDCAASVWVPIMGAWSNKGLHTATQENVEALRDLHHQLETSLQKRDTEIEELRTNTKKAKLRGESNRSVSIVRMLKRVLALKKSRGSIAQHIHTVELQIDALENSEFNQNLLKTIQTSSETMRRMGLDKNLQHADDAISTLEDSLQTSVEISAALSVPALDHMNDDDLDAELDSIMGEDTDGVNAVFPVALSRQIPCVSQNSMFDDDKVEEPVSSARVALLS